MYKKIIGAFILGVVASSYSFIIRDKMKIENLKKQVDIMIKEQEERSKNEKGKEETTIEEKRVYIN